MKRDELETLEKELVTSHDLAISARKHATAADKLADEMHPARPAKMSRFLSDEEKEAEFAEYKAAVEQWEKDYCIPAAKLAQKANAAELYEKAVREMWEKKISALINERIASPEFLDKYAGMPVRYKKLQKALFDGFDPRYRFYFTGVWKCRIGWYFRPDPENNPNLDFSGDCYYYGDDTTYPEMDTIISREKVMQRLEWNARPDYQPFVMPEFKAVRKACSRAAWVAHKHDEILTAAATKAADLVSANCCGLTVVNNAMHGEKDINYRR